MFPTWIIIQIIGSCLFSCQTSIALNICWICFYIPSRRCENLTATCRLPWVSPVHGFLSALCLWSYKWNICDCDVKKNNINTYFLYPGTFFLLHFIYFFGVLRPCHEYFNYRAAANIMVAGQQGWYQPVSLCVYISTLFVSSSVSTAWFLPTISLAAVKYPYWNILQCGVKRPIK